MGVSYKVVSELPVKQFLKQILKLSVVFLLKWPVNGNITLSIMLHYFLEQLVEVSCEKVRSSCCKRKQLCV